MMAQSRAKSIWDIYNYGKYINQFPPNTIKSIQQYERINKKICRQKISIMFNQICLYIYIYIYYFGNGKIAQWIVRHTLLSSVCPPITECHGKNTNKLTKIATRTATTKPYDWALLNNRDIRDKCVLELRNRFKTLQEKTEIGTPNDEYENFVNAQVGAAAKCIPTKPRAKYWVPWETLAVIKKTCPRENCLQKLKEEPSKHKCPKTKKRHNIN